jgi:protein deglycase
MRVVLPLATGFEEIEAVTIIDVLRRAEIDVVVAGLEAGLIKGSHAISMLPDTLLSEMQATDFDAIVLPGGPGVAYLKTDPNLRTLLLEMHKQQKWIAAICAAPIVLSELGLLGDRKATSYPGVRDVLQVGNYLETSVVIDGKIVTSRGVGTALEFALCLVALWISCEKAEHLASAMVYKMDAHLATHP